MKKTLIMCTALMVAGGAAAQPKISYPKAKTVDVVDDYFGTKVADPYRWLEDDNSAETASWVKAENEITQEYLKKIPFRRIIQWL